MSIVDILYNSKKREKFEAKFAAFFGWTMPI